MRSPYIPSGSAVNKNSRPMQRAHSAMVSIPSSNSHGAAAGAGSSGGGGLDRMGQLSIGSGRRRYPLLLLIAAVMASLAVTSTVWAMYAVARPGPGGARHHREVIPSLADEAVSVAAPSAVAANTAALPLSGEAEGVTAVSSASKERSAVDSKKKRRAGEDEDEEAGHDAAGVHALSSSPPPSTAAPHSMNSSPLLRLRRIAVRDVKRLVLGREKAMGSKGQPGDTLQIVLQSARTGSVLHPVGFSTPSRCDTGLMDTYTAAGKTAAVGAAAQPNAIVLPSSPIAGCPAAALAFSPFATSAFISVADYNAAVYNVTLAARKFKKVDADGLVVAGAHHGDGGEVETLSPEEEAAPKDLRLRAANYGTYLSREVHYGTVTVDKMWARSMESWTIVGRSVEGLAEGAAAGMYSYELRGIQHELQANGEKMCIGFDGAVPQHNHAAGADGAFIPPRFIEVGPVGDLNRAKSRVVPADANKKGNQRAERGPQCDEYILWELVEGEAERAIAAAAATVISSAATNGGDGDDAVAVSTAGGSATPIHFVAALSIRNMAVFSSEKQQYNDKVVFNNWLRLLQKGNERYPSQTLTQLALCLDVPEDLGPILKAAEGYGYTEEGGTVVILRSPAAVDPPSSATAEGKYTTHRSLRHYFASKAYAGSDAGSGDGRSAPIVPLLVVSAHCEKHPSYKNQPTYRGAFAFAEYVLRASQLQMQLRRRAAGGGGGAVAGEGQALAALHSSVPIAVDTSFVAFANSDIVLDYTDVFRTLGAVAAEMVAQPKDDDDDDDANGAVTKPRPVLVSGRRWNCGTHHIQKAMKKKKAPKKHKGRRREDGEGQGESPSTAATYMDTHYLRKRCTLFGDNAQDYFIVTAGALHWGMPPGITVGEAYAGASGALRRAIDDSHTGITVLVQDRADQMRGSAMGQALGPDHKADSLVPAADYRRMTRPERWNSHAHYIPPFVVGGIAFDNWFVSAMMEKRRPAKQLGTGEPMSWVIDASSSLYAFHINHDEGRFQSHRATKSDYNLEMAHYCNGWPEGKVGVSPIVSLRLPFDASSSSVLPQASSDGGEATRVVIHRRSILYCPLGVPAQRCKLPPPNVERRVSAFDGMFEPRH